MIVRAVTLPPAQTPRPRRASGFVKVLPPPAPLPTRRTLSSISSYVPAPPRVTLPSIEVQLDDDEAITAAHPSPVPPKPSADRETLPEVIIPRAPRMPSEMSNVIPLRPIPPRPMDAPVYPQSVPYAPAVSSQMASAAVRAADLEADRAALRAEAIQIVREAVARVEGARPPTDSGAGLRWLVTGILTGIFGAYLIFAAATRQNPRLDANEVAKAVIAQQAQQAHAQPPAPLAALPPAPAPAAHAPTVVSNPIPVIPSMDVENLPKHPPARSHAWHPAPRPAARRAAPPPPAAADEPSADDALGPVLATK